MTHGALCTTIAPAPPNLYVHVQVTLSQRSRQRLFGQSVLVEKPEHDRRPDVNTSREERVAVLLKSARPPALTNESCHPLLYLGPKY